MKITEKQYNRLIELNRKSLELQQEVESYYQEAAKITGEGGNDDGYTFDYIWNGYGSVDELLEKIQIEVMDK